MKKCSFIFILLSFLFTSCVPGFEKEYTKVEISLEDLETRKVYDLGDRQDVDSLYLYFHSNNPALSYIALQSFASIQDPNSIDSIATMLDHPFIEIRAMAAYVLGQIGDKRCEPFLIKAFKRKDTLNTNNSFNSNILEAIGKCGSENMLNALSTISTYRSTDTLLLLGQARGLYRYALRNMTTKAGTQRMVSFLTDNSYPPSVRLIAANYLQRAKDIDFSEQKFQLVKYFTSDPDPFIRMSLATALSKYPDLQMHSFLINQLDIEKNEAVIVNIIKSLNKFPYIQSIDKIITLIQSKNDNIAKVACQFLIDNGNPADIGFYKDIISIKLSSSVNSLLFISVFNNTPHYYHNTRRKLVSSIKEKIDNSKTVYDKANYIRALAYDPNTYILLRDLAFESNHPAVGTACIEALQGLVTSPLFTKTFKSRHIFKRREIVDILLNVFKKGDSGMMAVAADIILDPASKLKDVITEVSYLIEARNKLSLPREIETYNKLQEAIDLLNGNTFVAKKLKHNHPIDWTILETISDTSVITIKTDKGNFAFTPYTLEAPGTVANFVDLAEKDYYDGKNFHRVVSNFVAQGGCPRGDGFGSLDYTIRSELAPLYYDDSGYLGMASAGKHTEGVQFFVTHNPTPHLDGRYTIFGKVKSGMDVVNRLNVGDRIIDIIIVR